MYFWVFHILVHYWHILKNDSHSLTYWKYHCQAALSTHKFERICVCDTCRNQGIFSRTTILVHHKTNSCEINAMQTCSSIMKSLFCALNGIMIMHKVCWTIFAITEFIIKKTACRPQIDYNSETTEGVGSMIKLIGISI